MSIETLLRRAVLIFWDFDGVIKDSVGVKSQAFEKLFLPYGQELTNRVRRHHESNGGVSRFQKIPLYLKWAGESADIHQVDEYCLRFSALVLQAVVDAPWVPGVHEYLQRHYIDQKFVLISATPQSEIEQILEMLKISHMFCEIYGAPKTKTDIIRDVLFRLKCSKGDAVVVGDSETDMNAADKNEVPFILRKTELNHFILDKHSGPVFEKLNDEELGSEKN